MRMLTHITVAAGAVFTLSACAASQAGEDATAASGAPAASAGPVYVRQVMQTQINPPMLAIWDVGNNAMNEAGGIDPALMDDAKWAALNQAANRLVDASRVMAAAQAIHAARPDNSATGEGEVTMATVQRLIDADPDGFRRLAAAQAEHASNLAAAAAARDASQAGELVAGMDGVCEACHARYWYAEQ